MSLVTHDDMSIHLDTKPALDVQTDRQTDRPTDGRTDKIGKTKSSSAYTVIR